MTKLNKGDIAPKFTATIAEGKAITLDEFKGKYVILYFYPKDNTPGCIIEAKGFSSFQEEFNSLSAEIIGVSKDDIKSHEKFCNNWGLTFKLISDVEGKLCDQYGVWVEKSMFGKKYMGIQRATFLINPEGMIEHIWPSVSVKGHAEDVLNTIKSLV